MASHIENKAIQLREEAVKKLSPAGFFRSLFGGANKVNISNTSHKKLLYNYNTDKSTTSLYYHATQGLYNQDLRYGNFKTEDKKVIINRPIFSPLHTPSLMH